MPTFGRYGQYAGSQLVPTRAPLSGVSAYGTPSIWSLNQAAAAQIRYATEGYPLSSIDAETAPPDFYTSAGNTSGANYRAAYWLAVGARIAHSRGGSRVALLADAASYFAKAAASNAALFSVLWWWSYSEEIEDIQAIFYQAAAAADNNGVAEVGRMLRQLGSTSAIKKQLKATDEAGLVADAPRRWLGVSWKPVVVAGAALLIIAAGAAWYNRRELAKIAKAVVV